MKYSYNTRILDSIYISRASKLAKIGYFLFLKLSVISRLCKSQTSRVCVSHHELAVFILCFNRWFKKYLSFCCSLIIIQVMKMLHSVLSFLTSRNAFLIKVLDLNVIRWFTWPHSLSDLTKKREIRFNQWYVIPYLRIPVFMGYKAKWSSLRFISPEFS